MPTHQKSIGFRITAVFVAVQVLGLLVLGVITCLLFIRSMRADKVQTLNHRCERIVSLLAQADANSEQDLHQRFADLNGISGDYPFIQVLSEGGTLLYPARQQRHDALANLNVADIADGTHDLWLGKEEYLLVARHTLFRSAPVKIVVGGSLADSRVRLRLFVQSLLASGLALLMVTGLLATVMARRALLPIVTMTSHTQYLRTAALAERLPLPGTQDELDTLAVSWNELLETRERVVKELKQFAADTSHELRSPIALIQVEAEYCLLHCQAPEEMKLCLNRIVEECISATELLSGLLALARAEHNLSSPTRQDIDLIPLVQETVQKMLILSGAHQQRIQLTLPSGAAVICDSDEQQLQQALRILLDNAIRYTQPGGLIKVLVIADSRIATIIINDNGPGISSEHLSKLFNRFYRVQNEPNATGQQQGSGLGLAIAKKIIESHGGSIALESVVQYGTTLTMTLPLNTKAAQLETNLTFSS